jgi:hypothetical protein
MAAVKLKTYDVYELRDLEPSYIGYVEATSYKNALSVANNRYGAEIIVE